jgi:NAD(P)-dependent dehydrogenase (short-subunit alcohol dehydrogenase family)
MNAVVIGGSGGIGRAFTEYLLSHHRDVFIHATYHKNKPTLADSSCEWHRVDVTEEAQIEKFCTQLGEVDLCINAAGLLHDEAHMPEKSVKQFESDYFMKSMRINAVPSLILARYMVPHFQHKRPAVFATVSARVGSIEENYLGGWYSYRASKAALNMALKTLSIEWKRSLPNVAVAALHPGTTDTALSEPFHKNIKPEQLFPASKSVDYMMQVINALSPDCSGKFWSFDGEELPW